jgi:hypothetical protein
MRTQVKSEMNKSRHSYASEQRLAMAKEWDAKAEKLMFESLNAARVKSQKSMELLDLKRRSAVRTNEFFEINRANSVRHLETVQ